MHPVKAGPELGLRPTFRTVPAALCCLSGFACVRCLTYLSKDVCLRERQRYRCAAPAIHLRRPHGEDELPSIERPLSALPRRCRVFWGGRFSEPTAAARLASGNLSRFRTTIIYALASRLRAAGWRRG